MAALKKRARRAKTGLAKTAWRKKFGEAAKFCAKHKKPGEKLQECVRRYLKGA